MHQKIAYVIDPNLFTAKEWSSILWGNTHAALLALRKPLQDGAVLGAVYLTRVDADHFVFSVVDASDGEIVEAGDDLDTLQEMVRQLFVASFERLFVVSSDTGFPMFQVDGRAE